MAKRTTKKPDIINLDDTPDLTDFMLSAEAKTSDMFVEELLFKLVLCQILWTVLELVLEKLFMLLINI